MSQRRANSSRARAALQPIPDAENSAVVANVEPQVPVKTPNTKIRSLESRNAELESCVSQLTAQLEQLKVDSQQQQQQQTPHQGAPLAVNNFVPVAQPTIPKIKSLPKPKPLLTAKKLFKQSIKAQLAEAHPNATRVEITAMVNQQWKELPAASRAPFEHEAQQDKARFQSETEAYLQRRSEEEERVRALAMYSQYQEQQQAMQHYQQFVEQQEAKKAAKKAKRGKPRDPNKPKKPCTPYMIFCNEQRASLKAQFPDKSVTELSRLAAEQWGQMSPTKKRPFEKRYQRDLQIYTQQITQYREEMQRNQERQQTETEQAALQFYKAHVSTQEEQIAARRASQEDAKEAARLDSGSNATQSKKKAPRDPNQPKRPLTSFVVFCNAERAAVKLAHPDWKPQQIVVALGERWKQMTDLQKKPFADQAEVNRQRHLAAMQIYKATQQA